MRRPINVSGKAQTGQLLVSWILSAASIFVTASIVPGFVVKDFMHCALAAVILGMMNAFARPTLEGIFSPLTSVSFALSMFLINAALIWVAGNITPGMIVAGVMPAILGSVVLTTVNTGLDSLIHQPLVA